MTTFLLVRHAASEFMREVYVGRKLDPPLTQEGDRNARALAEYLNSEHIDIAETSPRRRARQTAEHIVKSRNLELKTEEALDEIDVGDWGGKSFEALAREPAWQSWNVARHLHRPPGGEAMLDVQQRIVGHLMEMQRRHPERVIVIVSHAEVIRSALLYYLGMPVLAHASIEVSPAAVARLRIDDHGAALTAIDDRATLR
jgi:broad specificity phosphatase PhoE